MDPGRRLARTRGRLPQGQFRRREIRRRHRGDPFGTHSASECGRMLPPHGLYDVNSGGLCIPRREQHALGSGAR
jgi:hypothetical protein